MFDIWPISSWESGLTTGKHTKGLILGHTKGQKKNKAASSDAVGIRKVLASQIE